jgi:hypothetical protein
MEMTDTAVAYILTRYIRPEVPEVREVPEAAAAPLRTRFASSETDTAVVAGILRYTQAEAEPDEAKERLEAPEAAAAAERRVHR